MKALLKNTLLSSIFAALLAVSNASATSSHISLSQAADEAVQLTAKHPGWKVLVGSGSSMDPHYGDGDVVIVDKSNLQRIRPGMIVVYRDDDGDLVGHTVVGVTPQGFLVKGVNNDRQDREVVNSSNYRGVVVGVLHTSGEGESSLPRLVGKRQ